ncbi:geranylgeranyl diphosphate synthase type I [Allocatelliglobosispora scoriae]|uniref:Geranylgeranyl diphosphate synthase type I n=1 Tax=Allocatelliglobosispora scoriae TaxID=643052 RepID=A0A841C392_9ACTN|nr:polyprenyl synthetase family protein [Allocatelliglobosispora scoriae]MBB5873603.1 geranylgeranyl diphosphate synthase type I [Allocatelliglobosispora scoriae]
MNTFTETRAALEPHELRWRVDETLADFLSTQGALWPEAAPQAVLAELSRFVTAGGKRLRPAFCYYGYLALGGATEDGIIPAAASLELLHAFALIHDDIMDASDTRRGHPTLHRSLAGMHRREGWRGDSDLFGTGTAILCGDLCFAWSEELFSGCGLPAADVAAARRILMLMRTETIGGQYLDLREQADPGTVETALRVVRFKTAKYTVERPLQIGLALAGGDTELSKAFGELGETLGVAFQLRDDLLGVFGDPARTGKSDLDDLREGKATVLMAAARARATALQIDELDRLVGDPELDEAGAQIVREIITGTGAVAVTETMIADRAAEAYDILQSVKIADEVRPVLESLIAGCVRRDY